MELDLYNTEKQVVGKKNLDDGVFSAAVNENLLHDVVTSQLAKLRRGTASSKTRGEVVGSGKKPWKQKGTGNARAGTVKSPLWRSGGVTFGPTPRQYILKVNKKSRKKALCSALTVKATGGQVYVVDQLELKEPKTRELVSILKQFDCGGKVLILIDQPNTPVMRSAKNLKGVRVQQTDAINVYDLLACKTLFLTEGAVSKIEENLTNG
ncbi:MAG: 50S ribosomal protein L4 [Nitrospinota bacterium]